MGYAVLEKKFYRLAQLGHLGAMVGWDQHVMMPPKGNEARRRAMAELSVIKTESLQQFVRHRFYLIPERIKIK